MSNHRFRRLIHSGSFLLLGWAGAVSAADPVAATHACASVVEPNVRLACYDAAFPVVEEVREAAAHRVEREFGLSRAEIAARNPDPVVEGVDPDRVEATIVDVVYGTRQERIFTLDNDQVWVQTDTSTRGRAVVGDKIEIQRGMMGNYTLRTPARVGIPVRRSR